MWRKNLRSYQSLTYRKKYKCPVCNEYSLHIIHDFMCECENECDVYFDENLKIEDVILTNVFDGYYTLQDIDEIFDRIDNEKMNKKFKSITDDPLLKGMSDKRKKEIEELYSKTIEIDSQLDDVTVKYLNKYKIKEGDELTPFSYVMNLVEDIHHFLNLSWGDVCLFYYGSNLVHKKFYTERFFFDNCIDHIYASIERIYVFLGIYYDFNFSVNLSENKTAHIKNFLKTNSNFKNSKIKKLMDIASGNSIINTIRGYNIHDFSYINNKIMNDIEKNPDKIELYDADSTDVNKRELKPELPKILKTINHYYDVLFEVISMMENNDFKKNIPMLNIFWNDILNLKQVEYQYSGDFLQGLYIKLSKIFVPIRFLKNKYILDVFFRINDIVHCIADVFNIEWNKYFLRYGTHLRKNSFILRVDKQYLMYSSVIRLYACYDKLSKYLNEFDNRYQDIKYFSDFSLFEFSENNVYDQKITKIINNEFFQGLKRLRNNIYHSLCPGCMGGEVAVQQFNNIITQVVFENTKIVLEFLEFIIENNQKIIYKQ